MNLLKFDTPFYPRKILFLGYNSGETALINTLSSLGHQVIQHSDNLTQILPLTNKVDAIISYGYKHIIRPEHLKSIALPIINLHISYLPWNRGAHPNFWAFYDSTPIGVSIHLIDEGIDSGPILFQKIVSFEKYETTFSLTYKKLRLEIENLFTENMDIILSSNFSITPQPKYGTLHYTKDLPVNFLGWEADISSEISRLKNISY